MRCASIDIGSNTLRLLVAELYAGGVLKPLDYRRAITRLAGGYTQSEGIDLASAQRTFDALSSFRAVVDGYGVSDVFAVATSVVRRAANREWFVKEVSRRTGFEVEVISGDEEARLSFLGVLSVIGVGGVGGAGGVGEARGRRLVMDIGGGSTEFVFTEGEDVRAAFSMDMGVVHLTETHLKSDPPAFAELEGMDREVKGVIEKLKRLMKDSGITIDEYSGKARAEIVGTAGTVTTLAAIDQGLGAYDRDKVNNWILKKGRISEIYSNLVTLTLKQRGEVLSLEKGREHLIIPGIAIAANCMESFGFDSMRVSDAGLLEGVILRALKTSRPSEGQKRRLQ